MKKSATDLSSCLTLIAFSAVFRNAFAATEHWNPLHRAYHPLRYQDRKEEDVKAKISFQGYSYAGRSEFPWLVEIRGNNTEDFEKQEEWANGNLVASSFVLTVCYAVANTKKYEVRPYGKDDPIYNIGVDQTYLSPKNPKYYKVLYSDDYTYKSVENGYYTGTRQVKRFIPHPKCNQYAIDYQWGVVETKRPIWPVPPWTSYMPIDFNPEGFAEIKKTYTQTRADLTLAARCLVGLWGRRLEAQYKDKKNIVNVYKNENMWNYKVKYAVATVDPDGCWKPPAIDAFPRYVRVGESIDEWECMAINSNETMGAVCDHDRGAPIVCDGVVRAIVVVGATEKYCNINKPFPFLVMDIRFAFEMFAETHNLEWTMANLRHYLRKNR